MGFTPAEEDRIPQGHDIIPDIYKEISRAQDAFAQEFPERLMLAPYGGGVSMLLINTVLLLTDEVANLRDELAETRQNTSEGFIATAQLAIGLEDKVNEHIENGYHSPPRYA